MVDLQKVMSSYGDRVGSPGGGSKRGQSEAVMRAASGIMPAVGGGGVAEAGEAGDASEAEPPPSAIRPRARRPATSPKRAARRKAGAKSSNGAGAPVDHYDDLEADEIVTLLDSLEDEDLAALLEYEQANRARPRVTSAIEGTRARREASRQP
jgi:hypothetical protein